MSYFQVDRFIADGMILATYIDMGKEDQCLWTRSKSRQHTKCADSLAPIVPGDFVYRPVGNKQYRSARVLASHIERIKP